MSKPKSKVALSIVIPHYNMPEQLGHCVASIYDQALDRDHIEIIVVDNGSTVTIPNELQNRVDLWLVYNDVANPYACRNLGLKSASSEMIALLDCTCRPHQAWAKSGINALNQHIVVAGAFEKNVNHQDIYSIFYAVSHLNNGLQVEDQAPLVTGNLFLRKSVLKKSGYLPEDHRSGGDIKWTKGLLDQKISIGYEPSALVTIKAKTKPQVISAERRFGRGAYLQNRDLPLAHHLKMILYHLLPDKPSRIKRKIDGQDDPSIYDGKVWSLWWVTWHTNLLFLQGYLSGLLLPNRKMYLD